MKNISLLPPEIIALNLSRRRQRQFIKAGALAMVVIIVIYAGLWTATLHYQKEAQKFIDQRLPLEKQISGYQEFVQMEKRLVAMDKLVKQVQGNNPDWGALVLEMNSDIPPNLWLTEISFNAAQNVAVSQSNSVPPDNKDQGTNAVPAVQAPAAASGDVLIRGYAFDYPSVAKWLEKLRQVPALADIKCQYARQETLNSTTMIKFEIKSPVQSPETQEGGQTQ